MPIPNKFFNKEFRKDIVTATIEWLALSAAWYLIQIGANLDWKAILRTFGSSFALVVLWHTIRYSIGSQLKRIFDEVMKYLPHGRIVIHEQNLLIGIKDATPIYSYYHKFLEMLPERITNLSGGIIIPLDPYSIYSHILHCAESCSQENRGQPPLSPISSNFRCMQQRSPFENVGFLCKSKRR